MITQGYLTMLITTQSLNLDRSYIQCRLIKPDFTKVTRPPQ
jgi:hypothetical protein